MKHQALARLVVLSAGFIPTPKVTKKHIIQYHTSVAKKHKAEAGEHLKVARKYKKGTTMHDRDIFKDSMRHHHWKMSSHHHELGLMHKLLGQKRKASEHFKLNAEHKAKAEMF